MSWQDLLIGIANVGFILALLPLLFSLFGVKTIELGLVFTGIMYGCFLILATIGILGLGAYFGGIATLAAGILWFGIAIVAKVRAKNRPREFGK
ncbi:hypothetical protein A2880_01115 [Candidatus Peribacteria bacterium RIFCSPHIGHO2_01_FULL_49_38]|nr:MAG: hypothetical protein A2880_01115 [Candidatus Peribacteria bacterium RIFCSPHIGHO2_01_FULL_49_38]